MFISEFTDKVVFGKNCGRLAEWLAAFFVFISRRKRVANSRSDGKIGIEEFLYDQTKDCGLSETFLRLEPGCARDYAQIRFAL